MSNRPLLIWFLLFIATTTASAYGPYDAELVRVIDGDTIKASVYVWPGLTVETSVRVEGVNSPELRASDPCEKVAGRAAKQFAVDWFSKNAVFQIANVKQGKFAGRVIARIISNGNDYGQGLIAAGHAVSYDGGSRGAWCK